MFTRVSTPVSTLSRLRGSLASSNTTSLFHTCTIFNDQETQDDSSTDNTDSLLSDLQTEALKDTVTSESTTTPHNTDNNDNNNNNSNNRGNRRNNNQLSPIQIDDQDWYSYVDADLLADSEKFKFDFSDEDDMFLGPKGQVEEMTPKEWKPMEVLEAEEGSVKAQIITRRYLFPGGDTDHPGARKAILKVKLPDLGLTDIQEQRLMVLTGSRYNHANKELTLTSEKYQQRHLNVEHNEQLLRHLVDAAQQDHDNDVEEQQAA